MLSGLIIAIGIFLVGLYSFYPRSYKELVYKYAQIYELDPFLVYAVMKTESKHNPHAISRSGAKGLMQIMDRTGAWGAQESSIENYTHEGLFNPEVNIQVGCWYLARLIKQYDNQLELALAAYNAGTGNVAKWRSNPAYSRDGITLESIPFKETKLYIKRVKRHYKFYQFLYRY